MGKNTKEQTDRIATPKEENFTALDAAQQIGSNSIGRQGEEKCVKSGHFAQSCRSGRNITTKQKKKHTGQKKSIGHWT